MLLFASPRDYDCKPQHLLVRYPPLSDVCFSIRATKSEHMNAADQKHAFYVGRYSPELSSGRAWR